VLLEQLAGARAVVGEQDRRTGGGQSGGLAHPVGHRGEQRDVRRIGQPDGGVGPDLQLLGDRPGHASHDSTDKNVVKDFVSGGAGRHGAWLK
jgi:hypothetical protein